LYRFEVIAAYCSNFRHFAFLSPLVHLGLIGKCYVDFLLVLIELFSAEVLRVKIDWKSAISLQRGQFDPKFQVEGDVTHLSFLHGQLGQWMP